MTDVLFVRLEQRDKALHLCRWAQRFFDEGEPVLIRVEDDEQAQALDRYLWTFSKDAFLPHGCAVDQDDTLGQEPIVIVTAEENLNNATRLLLGAPCSLEFIACFPRAIDFAELYDADLAQQSRQRFSSYRQAGFNPRMA